MSRTKLDIDCPECGETLGRGTLVIRINSSTGHVFIGCSNWPVCKHTDTVDDMIEQLGTKAPGWLLDYKDINMAINSYPEKEEGWRDCDATPWE